MGCSVQPATTLRRPPRWAARRRARQGATVVEFAFVMPVLLVLVLGIIEVGRAVMVTHLLNHAARHGCRVAVIEGKSNSDVNSAVTIALSGASISGESVTVAVNGAAGNASAAQAGDEITVTVTVPASAVTWLPGGRFLNGLTMTGQDTLWRE